MTKLGRSALTDAVKEELVMYLRNGTINEQSVTQTLDITGLQIQDLSRLNRIHFCLSDEVVKFVDALQERLRRVKTSNQRKREYTHGEVRGRIDWQETTRLRSTESIGDRTRFACKTPYTEYDIPENLVLKKLLWLIHSTVQSDIAEIDYEWRTEAWPADRITVLDRIYARNVHLNRIADGKDIVVTRRMLNTARSARQSLYTDAYRLFDRYRRLMDGSFGDDDISQLLSETLVVPERLPRLFELFCIFRLLRALDSKEVSLQIIEPGAKQLATLEGDQYTVDIYHDQTGNLSFYVPFSELNEGDSPFIRRYRHAVEHHRELVTEFLGIDTRPSLYSGRPDLVIEVYETKERESLTDILLGEIKYSDSKQTFAQGLKELTEYIEFAQRDEYLKDQGVNINGVIITDGVNTDVVTSSNDSVTHLTADQLYKGAKSEALVPEPLLQKARTNSVQE